MASTNDSTISLFIEKFKSDFGDRKRAESFFTCGYCFHFAAILDSFGMGEIVYNAVMNHFAFYSFVDKFLYDITGCLGEMTSDWVPWEEYQKIEPTNSRVVKNCCVYKFW